MIIGIIHRIKDVNSKIKSLELSKNLVGHSIYCPLCTRELKGWIEGCTIIHLYCENCNIALSLVNKDVFENKDLETIEESLLNFFERKTSGDE